MTPSPITQAIQDIRAGRIIILVDDANRENEGDFVFAAEKCTPELINVMVSQGRGLICLPMTVDDTRRLSLPQQVQRNEAHLQTAFTVSIDAARGIGSGISASDRSQTVLTASHPLAQPGDLVRPGHIFPLAAKEGGVLVRPGHTEAGVDLARLAGLRPMAVICEVLNERGEAARLDELFKIAQKLGLRVYTIRDLVEYRLRKEPLIRKTASVKLPTQYGAFRLHVYETRLKAVPEEEVHLALTYGKHRFTPRDIPLVRVHSEWSIATIVRRFSHPEGSPLNLAMCRVAQERSGAIVFLRHTPQFTEAGSPFHPVPKPADLWMENGALRTLGFKGTTMMGYGLGSQILRDLGIHRMRILSNSDVVFHGIGNFDLEIVERIPFGYGDGR